MPITKELIDQTAKHRQLIIRTAQLLYITLASAFIILCMLFIVLFKPSRSTNRIVGEDLATYKQEIEVLKSKLKQVEELQSKPVGKLSDNTCYGDMVKIIDARITRIEELLQGDPVRALSVPLLRRDLDNTSLRITEYQVAVREDFNRIYSVFMWAFGILVVVVLGTFAYFQRKLDAIGKSNGKE